MYTFIITKEGKFIHFYYILFQNLFLFVILLFIKFLFLKY